MWWFEASARPATSKGQILHLLQSIDSQSLTYLHRDLRSSFVAHAVKGVDAWLAVVEVGWWDPFGVAVGAFSGGPAAGLHQWVVGSAGQGQRVDVGAVGGGPVFDVVDFAPVAAHIAAGARAATILAVEVKVGCWSEPGRSPTFQARAGIAPKDTHSRAAPLPGCRGQIG